MVNGLSIEQVNMLLAVIDKDFNGKRNKALILILVDSGLRLGELLRLRLTDVDIEHQLVKVSGKVGERFVRFGSTTARALLSYLMVRNEVNSSDGVLWLSSSGQSLTASSVQSLFTRLSKKSGVEVHPHLLRHTFATLWPKNGGDSLMLQRLLGHSSLTMTNRYCQAVGCYDAIESHKRYNPVDNIFTR
jgi:site-specific recombinase XerD